jgi:hypothetical protein
LTLGAADPGPNGSHGRARRMADEAGEGPEWHLPAGWRDARNRPPAQTRQRGRRKRRRAFALPRSASRRRSRRAGVQGEKAGFDGSWQPSYENADSPVGRRTGDPLPILPGASCLRARGGIAADAHRRGPAVATGRRSPPEAGRKAPGSAKHRGAANKGALRSLAGTRRGGGQGARGPVRATGREGFT